MLARILYYCLSSALLISCLEPSGVSSHSANLNSSTIVVASMSEMQIEGRSLSTETKTLAGFPGVLFHFVPLGMDMTLELIADKEGQSVDIMMEGALIRFDLDVGENTLDLGPLWDMNPHDHILPGCDVKVFRRGESWQGNLTFVAAKNSKGFRDVSDPWFDIPENKLLFIGDSITAGAGTTSRLNDDGEREAVSNARLAYPRVLGDRLNAQVHHVAYGGRGLMRDWQGITDTNNAPQFYDRVLPDNPDHLWDPQDYQADVVSVMLGTNDFNPGIPDRESWTQAYQDFVMRIRTDYPEAQIFLISSPMTGGEKGEALKTYVTEVAEGFGSHSVRYLEVSQYYGEAWDSHPTAAEHQKIADELEVAFREALGE